MTNATTVSLVVPCCGVVVERLRRWDSNAVYYAAVTTSSRTAASAIYGGQTIPLDGQRVAPEWASESPLLVACTRRRCKQGGPRWLIEAPDVITSRKSGKSKLVVGLDVPARLVTRAWAKRSATAS